MTVRLPPIIKSLRVQVRQIEGLRHSDRGAVVSLVAHPSLTGSQRWFLHGIFG